VRLPDLQTLRGAGRLEHDVVWDVVQRGGGCGGRSGRQAGDQQRRKGEDGVSGSMNGHG
jgi:hypothetical protein